MAKKIETGGLISPSNLWAKPLPPQRNAPKAASKQGTRKMARDEDDVMEDEEIDVDAELAEADVETEEDVDDVDVNEDDTPDVEAEYEDDPEDEESEEESDDEEPDYDGEEGDVDDESQDGAEDDAEEVVTAVADGEDTGDVEDDGSTISEVNEDTMAEKMSLSDYIRAEIARREKAGTSLRGKDIVETLAKRNVKVSAAQVSQLLKKAGLSTGRKGRPKAAAATTEPSEKSRAAMKAKKKPETAAKPAPAPAQRQALKARPTATNGFKVPLGQLQAAEAFVDACGGSFKDAERILTAAAQLSQTFGG